MDERSFDRMTRMLGGAASRRSGLKAALGAALGLASADRLEARGNRGGKDRGRGKPGVEGPCGDGSRKDNVCTRDKECCTGYCQKSLKNRDGKGRCRCIKRGKPCKPSQTCCKGACVDGVCSAGPGPVACVPLGGACTPSDTCCDGNVCADGVCIVGVPTGDACDPAVDVCQDPAATCTNYLEHDPEGTYCVLPLATACAAGGECESGNCEGGLCALFACDVCTSGCPSDNLDTTLASAPDGAIIRVDAGVWTITNDTGSGAAGGQISDGRFLTVRACNGVAGVEVTSSDWNVFYIESPNYGGWTLEGLTIYLQNTNSAYTVLYIFGKDASNRSQLVMRRCTVDNRDSASIAQFAEVYAFTDAILKDTTFGKGAGTGTNDIGFLFEGDASSIGTLTMTGVTIQDGAQNGSGSSRGCLSLAAANVTLTDCTLSNCLANKSFGGPAGGGITVTNSFGPTNLTLAGTTTITANLGTSGKSSGAIAIQTKPTYSSSITIEPTVSITGNTGVATGGIQHMSDYQGNFGTLTVTGGSVVTGNTGTYECADVYDNNSTVTNVATCTWP